jgi:hypothetical protein
MNTRSRLGSDLRLLDIKMLEIRVELKYTQPGGCLKLTQEAPLQVAVRNHRTAGNSQVCGL